MSNSLVALKVHLTEKKPFFLPGDTIRGKVVVCARQDMLIHRLHLIWSGGIQVTTDTETQSSVYFKETLQLGLVGTPERQHGNSSYFSNAFHRSPPDMGFQLLQDKMYIFMFEVVVPMSLPSCTPYTADSLDRPGSRVIYTLDAKLQEPFARDHIGVPIFERIDAESSDLTSDITRAAVFTVWRSSQFASPLSSDYKTALSVMLHRSGVPRGGKIRIAVSVWHNEAVFRENGIQISLVQTRRIRLENDTHSIPDKVLHTLSADLDVKHCKADQYRQVVSRDLQIPSATTPTIRSMTSELLDLEYQIVVTATAQQDVMYQSDTRERTSCMFVKVPFVITTLPIVTEDVKKTNDKVKEKTKSKPKSNEKTKEKTKSTSKAKSKVKEPASSKESIRRLSGCHVDPRPPPTRSRSKDSGRFNLFRRNPSPAASEKSINKVFSAFRIPSRSSAVGSPIDERMSQLGFSESYHGSNISGSQDEKDNMTRSNSSNSLKKDNTPWQAEDDKKINRPSLLLPSNSFSAGLGIPESFLISTEPDTLSALEQKRGFEDEYMPTVTSQSLHSTKQGDGPGNMYSSEIDKYDRVASTSPSTPIPTRKTTSTSTQAPKLAATISTPVKPSGGGRKVKYFDVFNDSDEEDGDDEEEQSTARESVAGTEDMPVYSLLKPDERSINDVHVNIQRNNIESDSESASSEDDLLATLARRERRRGHGISDAPVVMERVVN